MNDYRDAQKFMSKVSRKFYTTIPEQNSCAHLFSYNIVCNNASRYTLFYSFFNAVMDQKIKNYEFGYFVLKLVQLQNETFF